MTSVAEATQIVATEYNGWSNRETWVVNLWLSGEPSSYSVLVEAVSMQCPAVDKADWLKERLEASSLCLFIIRVNEPHQGRSSHW